MDDRTKSRALAMKQKCKDCMGNYRDGRRDCEVPTCPLYGWMPYRQKQPKFDWAIKREAPAGGWPVPVGFGGRKTGETTVELKCEVGHDDE